MHARIFAHLTHGSHGRFTFLFRGHFVTFEVRFETRGLPEESFNDIVIAESRYLLNVREKCTLNIDRTRLVMNKIRVGFTKVFLFNDISNELPPSFVGH